MQSERTDSSPDDADVPKPSFLIDEVDARNLIDGLGPTWRSAVEYSASPDSFSGGFMREQYYKAGLVQIGTMADGKVWNVQLTSGIGDRCGRSDPIAANLEHVVQGVDPTLEIDPEQFERLRGALDKEDGLERVDVGSKRVTTNGGCLKRLDIRTVWSAPLAH